MAKMDITEAAEVENLRNLQFNFEKTEKTRMEK